MLTFRTETLAASTIHCGFGEEYKGNWEAHLSQHQSVLNDTKPLDLFTNLLLIIRFSILYHLSFRSSPQLQITSPPYYSSQSSLSPKTARSTIEKKKEKKMQSLYYSALFANSIFFSMVQLTSAFPVAQNPHSDLASIGLTALEPIFATSTPSLPASIATPLLQPEFTTPTPLQQPTVVTTLFQLAIPTQPSAVYTPPLQPIISTPILSQPPFESGWPIQSSLTTPIATQQASAFTNPLEPALINPTPLPAVPILTTLQQPALVSLTSTPSAGKFITSLFACLSVPPPPSPKNK